MPSIKRIAGFRFFFFSRETNEPPHVHVHSAGKTAKFWLKPVALARSDGFHSRELGKLQDLVEEDRESFLEAWHDYFGG